MTFFTVVFTLLCCTAIVCAKFVVVENVEHMMKLFNDPNLDGVYAEIVLNNDLDFSHSNLTLPLGAFSNGTCVTYSGVFHGNGHSIKGLVMDNTDKGKYKGAGLFCGLQGATFENLVIDSSCSFSGNHAGGLSVVAGGFLNMTNITNKATVFGIHGAIGGFIGGLGSRFSKQGDIALFDNCVNEGNITGKWRFVGGFIGKVFWRTAKKLYIVNSTNKGTVNGKYDVGGIIGSVFGNEMVVVISHCINTGSVSGGWNCGGLVGSFFNSTNMKTIISHSINHGVITGIGSHIAGFFGLINSMNMSLSVSSFINNGTVTGDSNIGGLFGSIDSTNITTMISDSVNFGLITGQSVVGGFLGYIGGKDVISTISSCLNQGRINGQGTSGGFIGFTSGNKLLTTFSNCTNNGTTTGNGYTGGFVGEVYSFSKEYAVVLGIMNSANKATISADDGYACGFFCVDTKHNFNTKMTIYNALNKGSIQASSYAFGLTNTVTRVSNIVSMGKVIGSLGSYTFWNTSTNVDLFYGLDGSCFNCSAKTTLFQHNTSTGFYEVIGSGQHVHDLLNDEVKDKNYGMTWTSKLELGFTSEYVQPSSKRLFHSGGMLTTLCLFLFMVLIITFISLF